MDQLTILEFIHFLFSGILLVWGGNLVVKIGVKKYIDKSLPTGFPSSGKYIGMLERILIFIFLIKGFYSLIGFLLTIKAIYRFGDIQGNDQTKMKLSEYFIIGSLLSLLWVTIIWLLYDGISVGNLF